MIFRRPYWLVFVLCAAPAAATAASDGGENRIALVIGNSAYKSKPLANPINDARAVARALNDAGFAVKVRTNLTRSQMREEIRRFGDELREQRGVGLFFFAGHGVQVNGRNYLIPVSSDIRREHEVEDEALDANFVLSTMESAKARMNIVILDACRDNPFVASFRSSLGGLAPMSTPSGSIIAYATAPGQTASDGDGANGLYTKHLVEQISVPGQGILDMFVNVRNGVQRDSGGRQTPWELSSLTMPFQFKPAAATAPAPAAGVPSGATQADIDRAVQAALRRREADDVARRSAQQSEIEQAVLAALRKREEEQAAAQKARAGKDIAEAQAAIARLTQELAELRASNVPEDPQTAAPPAASSVAPRPSVAAGPVTTASPPASQPAAAPESAARAPAQVALAAPAAPRAQPAVIIGGRVERPDVRVGDRWTYRVTDLITNLTSSTTLEAATITANRIYTRRSSSTSDAGLIEVWDRSWNLLRRGDIDYVPFYPTFQFPLEKDKSWSGTVSFAQLHTTTVHSIKMLAVGWERVTVPAGTFDALRINIQGHLNQSSTLWYSSGSVNNVVWYAPAIRQVVKSEIDQTAFRTTSLLRNERWELVEYKAD
jgi:uncharacterized caspase-like protein